MVLEKFANIRWKEGGSQLQAKYLKILTNCEINIEYG